MQIDWFNHPPIMVIWSSRLYILLGGVIGALAATIYLSVAPPKYEASASIMVAQVLGKPLESPAILAERIKLPTFFSSAASAACGTSDEREPGYALSRRLKIQVNRNAPFIALSVADTTNTQAAACLAAVIADIEKEQEKLIRPTILAKQSQLAELKKRIEMIRSEKQLTIKTSLALQPQMADFAKQSLRMVTDLNREKELRELIMRATELQIKLTPPLTQPTTLASQIYAPAIRASMSPWLFLLLSMIAGVLLAAALVFFKATGSGRGRS
jgi:uncharacterized protein involved in exopolysaccharide biosynthesis